MFQSSSSMTDASGAFELNSLENGSERTEQIYSMEKLSIYWN